MKVLIVDDDRVTADLLQVLFEMEGFEVACVHDSRSVVSSIEEQDPAIVLLDFYLGNTESTEIVRQIRSTPAIADVPIIVLSGSDRAAEALAAGANRFVGKPFELSELLGAIQDLTSQRDV